MRPAPGGRFLYSGERRVNAMHPSPPSTPQVLATRLQASYERLWQVLSLLEPQELDKAVLPGGWTPKALLAHIAFWDDYQTRRMQAALAGTAARRSREPIQMDNDQRAQVDAHRPWTAIVAEADGARARMIQFVQQLSPEALQGTYPEGEETLNLERLIRHMVHHTQSHTQELLHYCGSLQRWTRPGLRHFFQEQYETLMAAIGGFHEDTLLSARVCGSWSIRDVLAHVLAWNEYGYHLAKGWPEPAPASLAPWQREPGESLDALNRRLLDARSSLDPIQIADGLITWHRRLLRLFDQATDEALNTQGQTWMGPLPLSGVFFEIARHEAEHAAQIWQFRVDSGLPRGNPSLPR